jgi:ketosteroid isomerase-like protein
MSTTTDTTSTGTKKVDAREVFAAIDTLDVENFLRYLTPDVHFTFGNNPPADGIDQVREAVTAFFGMIGGMHHHIKDVWEVEDGVTVCYIQVEYVRKDTGASVFVPNVDILRWDGDKVADWRIVIDLAPVFS